MSMEVMRTVEALVAGRKRVANRERELIRTLNEALGAVGYRVMPVGVGGAGAGSPSKQASPAAKRLVCPDCGRRFGRPVHLGRHVSVAHKRKKAKPAKKSKPTSKASKAAKRGRRKAKAAKAVTKPAGKKAA